MPVYHHRILYFPVMGGVKREGVAGSMFLKKGGYQEGGIKKRKGGSWYTFPYHGLHSLCTNLTSKNVILPQWKALWTSLKLAQKFENHNANVKKITYGGLFSLLHSLFLCCNYFMLIWDLPRKLWGFLLFLTGFTSLSVATNFFPSINHLPCLYAQFLILFHLT